MQLDAEAGLRMVGQNSDTRLQRDNQEAIGIRLGQYAN